MDDSGVSSKPAPVVVGNVGAKYTEDGGVATTTVIESTSDSRILLCYMPVMVYWISFMIMFTGGDEEIMCLAIPAAIIGFIISLAILGLEVLKGFVFNIGISIFFSCLIGASPSVEDLLELMEEGFLLVIVMICVILPIYLHYRQKHVQALGAAYATPICMIIIMFGILIGIFGW
tara:strand:+ start:246 stop:770 length:525 start_codon:yes stop_codon:yes gene_type:complete